MVEQAPAISPAPPARASQNFALLREQALSEIQARAARTWTDHNLHDPGITIMEAFCYAITELGLRLELDMADLIASGRARAEPVLPPAEAVLPCAPVTAEDMRQKLLDHYLVGDAWLSMGVPDRIPYFADPEADPPLSYTPGGPRVTPGGLYEVLLAFEDPRLNTNIYGTEVSVGPDSFRLELALPHWDEPEAAPFRGGGVTVDAVTMLNPANPWRRLDESFAYFGRATVAFTGPGGAGTVESWVVLRITGEIAQPALVVPGILAAAQTEVESTAASGLFVRFQRRVAAADAAAATVARYLHSWRNLCQDPVRLAVSRVQEIAVHARVEVAQTTGIEELLAEILFDIDLRLSPPARFAGLAQLRAKGRAVADIFDGPLLTHGFVADAEHEPLLRGDTIFISDVLNLLMVGRRAGGGIPGQENPTGRDVVAVTELSLGNFVNNRVITAGATNCLRLVDVARHRPRLSVAKSRIVVVRDDVVIPYDAARVERLFQDLWAAQTSDARLAEFDPSLPAVPGHVLPVGDYYPFQYDLPPLYGVTEAGLPAEAGMERRQQALQLRAYLMLFEQFLADATEQLLNVNRLFSPAAGERTTYFTKPLFELSDLDRLVRAFSSGDFDAFAANPQNAYARALSAAAEDEATALDRRNRMLDHLLARHGEDAVAWGQELHRWGQKALLRTTTNLPALPQRIRARRTEANRELLAAKSAFLADVPALAAMRLQAFGDPLQWDPGLVEVTASDGEFTWQVIRDGTPVFEDLAPVETRGEAVTRAHETVRLAGTGAFYDTQDFGGAANRRYVLRSGPGATDPVLARGPTGFPNLTAAAAAAVPVREDFAALLLSESRTAIERRIDHLIGVRDRERRLLLTPLEDFFEVFDAAGPPFTKRWRVWADPGFTGTVHLESAAQFTAAVEADAVAEAVGDIERALEVALDAWNWRIAEAAPGSFTLTLVDADDATLATAPSPFASAAAAQAARDQAIADLYRRYSAEGSHLIETLLLRPHSTGDSFLALQGDDDQPLGDPYSHRLILVFPSGFVRDFGDAAAGPAPARPHRFRDPEFRRHAERVVRQSCPAHILPEIRWVDRQAPGTGSADGSLDVFEQRYLAWLRTVVIAGASAAAATAARNDLIASVNAIMGD